MSTVSVAGTRVTMADSMECNIENLKTGDQILSYNLDRKTVEPAKIMGLTHVIHENLVKLDFGSVQIISTEDHPYFVAGQGWCSVAPERTKVYPGFGKIGKLEVGTQVSCLDSKGNLSQLTLKQIDRTSRPEETYTITKLDRNRSFFANGLLVGVEEL